MQSTGTSRPAPVSLALVVVVAAGLAGGVIALGATDSLPGQGDSSVQIRRAPAVLAPTAGEGLVQQRQIEGLIGPGATLDSLKPKIGYEPSPGQGEGLVGPGTANSPLAGTTPAYDRADGVAGQGMASDSFRPMVKDARADGQGEGMLGPGASIQAPAAGFPWNPDIGFNAGDVAVPPLVPPAPGSYSTDPHTGGITEY